MEPMIRADQTTMTPDEAVAGPDRLTKCDAAAGADGAVTCDRAAADELRERVLAVLDEVKDPEIPAVSVRELGMVYRIETTAHHAHVQLLPTFVGCPALDLIRAAARRRLAEAGIRAEVEFVLSEPWTPDRITPEGIEKLRQFGIAPPVRPGAPSLVPPCPYCGAEGGEIENLFGPTPCRAIFYCRRCRQPFEGFKP